MTEQNELWWSYEHLLRVCCRAIMPRKVFEYGPGKSTGIILEEVPYANITSVEHQRKYYNRNLEEYGGKIDLAYKELSLKGGRSEGYITYPIQMGKKYDLIFIDGRSRVDCIVVASMCLNPGGVVIVHDTHRPNYHSVFGRFKEQYIAEDGRTTVLSNDSLDFIQTGVPRWYEAIGRERTLREMSKIYPGDNSNYWLRFGDAELYCIDDPMFANKRHQPKDNRMGKELRAALSTKSDYNYYKAFTVSGWRGSKIRELNKISSQYHRGPVYHVTAVHETFLKDFDLFMEFAGTFKNGNTLLVAGPSITKSDLVKEVFNITCAISMSDTNAYDMLDENYSGIKGACNHHTNVISALGHASTCLGYRLYRDGVLVRYIDIGSVVDALAENYDNRGWIKKNLPYVQERVEHLKKLYNL